MLSVVRGKGGGAEGASPAGHDRRSLGTLAGYNDAVHALSVKVAIKKSVRISVTLLRLRVLNYQCAP